MEKYNATGQRRLTSVLEERQVLLYGRVARQDAAHPMRIATFAPGGVAPAVDRYVRKVGRPRSNWTTEVGKIALSIAGSLQQLDTLLFDDRAWRFAVDTYYRQ